MARPSRNADPEHIVQNYRTFFVTTQTWMRKPLLQSDCNATLFIDVLRTCVAAKRFQIHDFVVMPDHVHLLLSVAGEMTIEKAMQFIKGGFSFRLKRETGYPGEVWQRGFTDRTVRDVQSFDDHRRYIADNPMKAGLAGARDEFPWCFASLAKQRFSKNANLQP